MLILLLTLIGMVTQVNALNIPQSVPIMVLDNSGNIAQIIDFPTFERIQKLSDALQDPNRPILFKKTPLYKKAGPKEGYSVSVPLTKAQISFLLEISQYQTPKDIINAIKLKKISFQNIDRNEVAALGLKPVLNAVLNNILILETADDTSLVVKKHVATRFFKTIQWFVDDNADSFTMPIPLLRKFLVSLLYSAAEKINYIKDISEQVDEAYEISKKQINSNLEILKNAYTKNLKEKSLTVTAEGITNQAKLYLRKVLSDLMDAANFLEAHQVIFVSCIDLYKEAFTEEEWLQEVITNQLLNQILIGLYRKAYPQVEWVPGDPSINQTVARLRGLQLLPKSSTVSIKNLLDSGDHSFYKRMKTEILWDNMTIESPIISNLTGLSLIPGIKECRYLAIRGTNINRLKKGDFYNLENIEHLSLLSNKKLTHLSTDCLKGMPNLSHLTFSDNNIEVLGEERLQIIAPKLSSIQFINNGLKIIKANWGRLDLTFFYLNEPLLTTIEKGWLNDIKLGHRGEIVIQKGKMNADVLKKIAQEIKIFYI